MTLGSASQGGVPGQGRGRAEGLGAALAGLVTGAVEHLEDLLAFGLPVSQACRQQRTGQNDAPVTLVVADADIDKLRVQHHAAKAFLHGFHGGLGVTGA